VRGGTVWFLTRDGSLVGRKVENGEPVATIDLGVLPAGGPAAVGDDLAIPVGPGTFRLLSAGETGGAR